VPRIRAYPGDLLANFLAQVSWLAAAGSSVEKHRSWRDIADLAASPPRTANAIAHATWRLGMNDGWPRPPKCRLQPAAACPTMEHHYVD
jgi:hypothetical protein